jgi:hypothetical protein
MKTKKAIAYCDGSLWPQSLAKQDKHYVSCEKKKRRMHSMSLNEWRSA